MSKEVKIKKAVRKKPKKKAIAKKEKELTAFEKLSPAHQEFVRQYIAHFGKAATAYKVVYPKISNNSAAAAAASRLLTKVNINSAIKEEYERIWKDRESELEKSKTFKMIHSIGESNIADIIDLENGTLTVKSLSEIPTEAQQAIQSVKYVEKETAAGGIDKHIEVKLHSKLQALELRAKLQNMIKDKMEFDGEIIVKPAVRPEDEEKKEIE